MDTKSQTLQTQIGKEERLLLRLASDVAILTRRIDKSDETLALDQQTMNDVFNKFRKKKKELTHHDELNARS